MSETDQISNVYGQAGSDGLVGGNAGQNGFDAVHMVCRPMEGIFLFAGVEQIPQHHRRHCEIFSVNVGLP